MHEKALCTVQSAAPAGGKASVWGEKLRTQVADYGSAQWQAERR